MYWLPSASTIRAPEALAMKRASPPTDPNARTGLLTPPGMRRRARSIRRCDSLVFIARQTGHRHDPLVLADLHQAHALRVAADRRHAGDAHANHLAGVGHQHDLIALGDLDDGDHAAVALAGLDGDDALAAAVLLAVVVERRALAVAALGHGQHGLAGLEHL